VVALHRLDERGDDPGIARAREPLEDADAEIGVLAPERGEEGIEAALGAQPLEQLEGVAADLSERGVQGSDDLRAGLLAALGELVERGPRDIGRDRREAEREGSSLPAGKRPSSP
jgi:hypothetical protein